MHSPIDFRHVQASSTDGSILFDVTDLFVYLSHHLHVSGIQRVTAKLFDEWYREPHLVPRRHTYCLIDGETGAIRAVSDRSLRRTLDLIRSATCTREQLDKAILACRVGPEIQPSAGDVFFILGAFWVSPLYTTALMKMRANGVRIGVYIYDLIPISHRHFVDTTLADYFPESAVKVLELCDFIATISRHVAKEVETFVAHNLRRSVPVTPVVLAQDHIPAEQSKAPSFEVQEASSFSYALCVGTIEIRKNHLYLLNLWRRLIAERGEDHVPNLVIVGRWGWRIDEFRRVLEDSEYLNGKVIVLQSVADNDLAFLYRNAFFSIFPSLVEGWGLPIGESLAYGVPCIASNSSSMPEVGREYVRYIDPLNPSDGYREVAALLDNPDRMKRWKSQLTSFKARQWREVAAELGELVSNAPAQSRTSDCFVTVDPGRAVWFSKSRSRQEARRNLRTHLFQLMFVSGWHEPEPWGGRWARTRSPVLRCLPSSPRPGQLYRVALRLLLPGGDAGDLSAHISLQSQDLESEIALPDWHERWYFATTRARADGALDLCLKIKGLFPPIPSDPRQLYVGVSAFAFCDESDMSQRVTMMEGLISS